MKINHLKMAKTLALLQAGPLTARDLAIKTQVHLITAQDWLRALKAAGAVHVSGWLPDTLGRDSTPVYSLGAHEDKPRRKTPHAEIARRYRQRQKEKAHAAR